MNASAAHLALIMQGGACPSVGMSDYLFFFLSFFSSYFLLFFSFSFS